jgi:hypothetical protein
MLYILTCPFIIRYKELMDSFITRTPKIDCFEPLLAKMGIRGNTLRKSSDFYQFLLPSHLHSALPHIIERPLYFPVIYMLSQYFTDAERFKLLCRDISWLGEDFTFKLFNRDLHPGAALIDATLEFSASKLSQVNLGNLITSMTNVGGLFQFGLLCAIVRAAVKNPATWTKLNNMRESRATNITSFYEEVYAYNLSVNGEILNDASNGSQSPA